MTRLVVPRSGKHGYYDRLLPHRRISLKKKSPSSVCVRAVPAIRNVQLRAHL